MSVFTEWLDSVKLTRPFTLEDAHELFKLVHDAVDAKHVDVFSHDGEVVHVRVETRHGVVITREIAVV